MGFGWLVSFVFRLTVFFFLCFATLIFSKIFSCVPVLSYFFVQHSLVRALPPVACFQWPLALSFFSFGPCLRSSLFFTFLILYGFCMTSCCFSLFFCTWYGFSMSSFFPVDIFCFSFFFKTCKILPFGDIFLCPRSSFFFVPLSVRASPTINTY